MSTGSPNMAVLCGLAVNPQAPLSILLWLAGYPQLGLLAPSVALLDRDHLPPLVAGVLAGHPHAEVRRRLAMHPCTPDETRCVLAEDSEPLVRAEVAGWPGCSIGLPRSSPVTVPPLPVEVYRGLAADAVPYVRAAVAKNHQVPVAVRAALAEDADPEVRRCATLRGLPPAVLHTLMRDADRAVRQAALMAAAIHSPETTVPKELAELFQADEGYYRQAAITLVELTQPLLEYLLTQPDLREALARNPSLPTERMRAFLADVELRVALAENPGLPVSYLEELVATEDGEVHRELLRRCDLPDRLRRRLVAASEDDEPLPTVFSLLPGAADLEERLSYLDHPNPAFRRTLALSFDLPSEAVRRLAEDPDFPTRLLVCERYTDVPPARLVEVAEHWQGHTRQALLRHPRLPVEALPRYAASDSALDREAIASRSDLPPELALELLADPEGRVRRAAAANPNLARGRLHQLLADADPLLREGAASNPALPIEDMQRLCSRG